MARSRGLGAFAKRIAVGAAFIVVAGAHAEGAWAGADGALTGTYEGKATCSGLLNGTPLKQKHEITGKDSALLTHGSTNAVLVIPDLGQFSLFVENNNQKPGQSLVSGVTCTLDLTLDGFAIFMNAKVKGDNATLKGTLLVLRDEDNESAICKISLKRVDTTDPAVICQS
jgi:hypothetical protein